MSGSTLLSHLELSVSDYAKSLRFYDLILGAIGWKRLVCQKTHTAFSDGHMKIIICPTDSRFVSNGFHRKRTGLNHIAFYANSKKFVDEFHRDVLLKNEIPSLYEKDPTGDDTYYALFFEDPDRIKIELVFSPQYCHHSHWTNDFADDFDPYDINLTSEGGPT